MNTKLVIMEDNSLQIQDTKLPHKPYLISDEQGNMIATLYHNNTIDALQYARLFKNAPKMEKMLWKVVHAFTSRTDTSLTEQSLLDEILKIQLELTEPIINPIKPTHWNDNVMDNFKEEV